MTTDGGPRQLQPDVVAVLVHGIGSQFRTKVLTSWGGALSGWLDEWARPRAGTADRSVEVVDSTADGEAPARSDLVVTCGGEVRRVRLVEALWADLVVPPALRALVGWLVFQLPLAMTHHVGRALTMASRRTRAHWADRRRWWARPLAVLRWAVSPAVVLVSPLMTALLTIAVAVVLLALLLGSTLSRLVPGLGSTVGSVQRGLVGTLGDTFFVVGNDIQRNLVVERVRRQVEAAHTAVGPDGRVVVLAHSQGAWVAHRALLGAQVPLGSVDLLTFGQGLAKIERLRTVLDDEVRTTLRVGAFAAVVPVLVWLARPDLLDWPSLGRALLALLPVAGYLLAFGLLAIGVLWVGVRLASRRSSDGATVPRRTLLAIAVAGVAVSFVGIAATGSLPAVQEAEQWLATVTDAAGWSLVLVSVTALVATWIGLRRVTDAELLRPAPVSSWTDVWASSDPVPNGRLFATPDRVRDAAFNLLSVEVRNHRDPIRDHNAYWKNRESFVSRVAELVLPDGWVAPELASRGDELRERASWLTVLGRWGAVVATPAIAARLGWMTIEDVPSWIPGRDAVPAELAADVLPWLSAIAVTLTAALVIERVAVARAAAAFDPAAGAPASGPAAQAYAMMGPAPEIPIETASVDLTTQAAVIDLTREPADQPEHTA